MDENNNPVEEKRKPMLKFNKRDLILGLLIAVLILWAYFAGQQSTLMFQDYIKEICPSLNVTAISPFSVEYQRQIGGYVGEGNFNLSTIDAPKS